MKLPLQSNKTLWSWLLTLWAVMVQLSAKRLMERHTKYGIVRGFVDVMPDGTRLDKFLGIPFAKPPVGKYRFEAPVPPDRWQGVRNAQELSPACPQPRSGVEYIQMYVPDFNSTDEDCLYLNIHAPKVHRHHQRHATQGHHQRKRHAVLVYVHGGSYQNGMGAMLEGSHLAARDVIVVTFNYRLGPLGFLETNDDVFPGNYGLLDMIAALRWIQENIHHFGGDPTRVTIDGHSAGGSSVGLLMLMPMAKGLFTRVIQQSGSPFANWALTRQPGAPNFYFKLFTAAVGCYGNGTAEVKACLQKVPAATIVETIMNQPVHPISLVPPFRPVVDGHVIPDTPERLAVYGEINGLEILTGTTSGEGVAAANPVMDNYGRSSHGILQLLAIMSGFSIDLPDINGLIEYILEQYYRWPYDVGDAEVESVFIEIVGDYFIIAPTQMTVDLLAARNVTVFYYNFNYSSRFDPWEVPIHGAELFYLSGYPLSGSLHHRYEQIDQLLALQMMQLWTNFAKNGLPSLVPHKHFHMPPYTPTRPLCTLISSQGNDDFMSVHLPFRPEKMAFWNQHVPKLYLNQLRNDMYLLNDLPNHGVRQVYETSDPIGSSQANDGVVRRAPSYISEHTSGNWILIAACIGLSVLTVLLSVCYCQVRRQIKTLIRQSSVSSGQAML